MFLLNILKFLEFFCFGFAIRGTSALHLNEATWIIDGSNELIVDFLFALVLFLDSTQPWPFKNPKQIFFFGSNKRMTCKSNSNAKPNPGQHHSSFHLLLHSNAGLVFLLNLGEGGEGCSGRGGLLRSLQYRLHLGGGVLSTSM